MSAYMAPATTLAQVSYWLSCAADATRAGWPERALLYRRHARFFKRRVERAKRRRHGWSHGR